MKTIARILILIIGLSYCSGTALASWTNPQEIITGSWGSSPGQFYFGSGDTEDSFPRDIGIDSQGRIFVNDEYNARVQVFNSAGSLSTVIAAPEGVNKKLGWPYNIYVHPNGNIVAGYNGPQKFFYDESGNLVKKIDVFGDAFPTVQGFIFYVQDNKYDFYSSTGQLIKTMTTRPLELGVAKEEVLDTGSYKTTVTYIDAVYTLKSDKQYERFSRDTLKNVFAILPGLVDKFDICGKRLGRLILPEDQVFKGGEVVDRERYIFTHSEYGEPVVDAHGNVYTWKRTPSNYTILKWTWVDDPNAPTGPDAPTGLSLMPSTTGIYLTWTASAQDPGCVTGYEVARATSSGGVFSAVATVNAGTVKYNDTSATAGTTYYYKIRAVAGTEYSPYTAEVSGKR